jgi:hypothetical protein
MVGQGAGGSELVLTGFGVAVERDFGLVCAG